MKSNSLSDTYEPQLQKSMKTVLCSRFTSEYGFLGGREVIELIVNDLIKIVTERIMEEADEQRGTLSQPDIALLLAVSRASIGKYIQDIQTEKGITLPYRGTIHDLGPTVTHRRDIVRLKLQKMSTPEIARRTIHSEEAVDRYINDYERVTRIIGIFEPIDIAFITNMSVSLVME